MVWTLGMDKCYRRSGFPKIPATQPQRWLLQPSPSLVARLLEKSHPWLCLTCLFGSRIRQLKNTALGQICWYPGPLAAGEGGWFHHVVLQEETRMVFPWVVSSLGDEDCLTCGQSFTVGYPQWRGEQIILLKCNVPDHLLQLIEQRAGSLMLTVTECLP